MTTILSQLPVEIIIIIVTYAADEDKDLAAKLCRVSSWIRDVVEPILYRVVCLNHLAHSETNRRLKQFQTRKFVRCFGLAGAPNLSGRDDLENHPFQTITNFASDSVYNLRLVVTENIEEMHLLNIVAYRAFEGITFPRLKRLHYCGRRAPFLLLGSAALSIPRLLRETKLTQLAISISEEPNMTNFISDIKEILKSHGTLRLLYIRILHSTALVLQGVDYESLEGQLASIGDSRLIVKRVDAIANTEILLHEWEQNARKGRGFWDWAEFQLRQRSPIRVTLCQS